MTDGITRYLTVDELIYINDQLPVLEPIHKILKGRQKVRDIELLEAAVGRPRQSVFGADAYPTVQEKAAALLHSVARNHPFADGNKRTATIAAIFMLAVNGWRVTWDPADALPRIVGMAEGQIEVAAFVEWLSTTPSEPSLVEDAEADASAIARIIAEHNWLLDELAER